jgi:hypothetical protein
MEGSRLALYGGTLHQEKVDNMFEGFDEEEKKQKIFRLVT